MSLPTDRTDESTIAEHVDDHNTLATQHNELEGHAADTTSVHGIADTAALALTSHNHTGTYEPAGTVATHEADASAAHAASAVAFTPTGGIAATDVQAAIAEVDSEKATTGHTHSGTYVPLSTIDAAGDLLVGDADNSVARLAKGSALQVLRVNAGATALEYADPAGGGGGNAIYGDGSDGVVNFDGSATVLGIVPSSGIYTMNRDVLLASGSQVSGTAILNTAGYRIYCNGTFTVGASATVSRRPANAAGATGGTLASQAVGGGVTGSNGATGAGTRPSQTNNTLGGDGGAAGAGSGGAGGTSRGSTSPAAAVGAYRTIPQATLGVVFSSGSGQMLLGGQGGASGGGDGTNAGGGGGSGGGVLILVAKSIVNNGSIAAPGGNGADGVAGNAGGGGGGGGGVVFLVYNSFSGNAATAAGGTKGNKASGGTGSDGSNGASGTVITVSNA